MKNEKLGMKNRRIFTTNHTNYYLENFPVFVLVRVGS